MFTIYAFLLLMIYRKFYIYAIYYCYHPGLIIYQLITVEKNVILSQYMILLYCEYVYFYL